MIRTGSIKNIPRITKQDVIRADRIYGKDISALKGRTTKTKADTVNFEFVPKPVMVNQVLHIDVMFVEGKPFLISLSCPLYLLIVN